MNIILTGFMCSGKSTVAKELSKICGYEVFDTDQMIEQKLQTAVGDIFAQKGEPFFRQVEHNALKSALCGNNRIISVGGGALTYEKSAKLIQKNGVKVYLTISPQTAKIRNDGSRPLLSNLSESGLITLFKEREKLYKNTADIIINSQNDTPDVLAQKIYRIIFKGDKY